MISLQKPCQMPLVPRLDRIVLSRRRAQMAQVVRNKMIKSALVEPLLYLPHIPHYRLVAVIFMVFAPKVGIVTSAAQPNRFRKIVHGMEPPRGANLGVVASAGTLSSSLTQMRILMIRARVAVLPGRAIFVVILQLSLMTAFGPAAKAHCLQPTTQSALQILIFRPFDLTKTTAIGVLQLTLGLTAPWDPRFMIASKERFVVQKGKVSAIVTGQIIQGQRINLVALFLTTQKFSANPNIVAKRRRKLQERWSLLSLKQSIRHTQVSAVTVFQLLQVIT